MAIQKRFTHCWSVAWVSLLLLCQVMWVTQFETMAELWWKWYIFFHFKLNIPVHRYQNSICASWYYDRHMPSGDRNIIIIVLCTVGIVRWLIRLFHDDVIKWKHFPRYWPFVRGIHRSSVNSPHKGQWRGALMFTLICARMNGWVNNGEAGDLRRNRAHYDVIVMFRPSLLETPCQSRSQFCHRFMSIDIGWYLPISLPQSPIVLGTNDPCSSWFSPWGNLAPIDFVLITYTCWDHSHFMSIIRVHGDGGHITDDNCKNIFMNVNIWILNNVF